MSHNLSSTPSCWGSFAFFWEGDKADRKKCGEGCIAGRGPGVLSCEGQDTGRCEAQRVELGCFYLLGRHRKSDPSPQQESMESNRIPRERGLP